MGPDGSASKITKEKYDNRIFLDESTNKEYEYDIMVGESITEEYLKESSVLGLNFFEFLSVLGLDLEIDFGFGLKTEIIRNVNFRSSTTSIVSSANGVTKVFDFEGEDIEEL